MALDLENNRYTFKENLLRINDLALNFEGFFQLLEKGYDMNLTFKAPETEFKHVLSLVPAIFLEGFEDLKTKGKFSLIGQVKGVYDDAKNTLPSVNLGFSVQEGFFQYPDLPTPVEHIEIQSKLDFPAVVI